MEKQEEEEKMTSRRRGREEEGRGKEKKRSRSVTPRATRTLLQLKGILRDVNVSYFLGFPIFSMLVLTHLFLKFKM